MLAPTPEEAVPDLLKGVGGALGPRRPAPAKHAAKPELSTDKLVVNDLVRALKIAVGERDVTLAHISLSWDGATWPFRHPLDYVGSEGGGGVGGGPGNAVGTALALMGTGRLAAAVCGDGDFMMSNAAIWTAGHYRIPLLIVVANNRSVFHDELHQRRVALAAAATITALQPAFADDQVKLTIGQRGNWDTAISHLGDKAGIFKKHGLALEMIYTAGSGETLQPVIAGSVDFGLAVGTLGAIAAYSKGAPVRIIGAEATGAAAYWYVKASPPIKTLKDLNGKSIAYSTAASSTESVVRAFIKENGLTSAKAMSTGGAPSTMTAVMTDQVDGGWASPPGGLH